MGYPLEEALKMPGFNAPLICYPDKNVLTSWRRGFPNALDWQDIEDGALNELYTFREILMMQIMNHITDKAEWDRKVFDEHITAKWREEVFSSGQDVTPKMMNWIIHELQWRAKILEQTNYVEVFGGVVKSNTAIPKELQEALREAVLPFENVPEDERDYHPGSDDKVIDLVHPSLFPVIYGRTRVLPDRTISLKDCLDSIGEGELLPEADEAAAFPDEPQTHPPSWSTKFQWLPCDVKLTQDYGCSIVSYINNAHPIKHKGLYDVVEKILTRTLPLWEQSLSMGAFRSQSKRIEFTAVCYDIDPKLGPEPEFPEDDEDEEAFDNRLQAWYESRPIILPEPKEFQPPEEPLYEKLNFMKHFPQGNFQVIVKLANIELTPEKPKYEGGTWHIEGQLNERIAASAIYYYDNKNITPSSIAFRSRGLEDFIDLLYEQERHEFLQQVYGFTKGVAPSSTETGQVTQDLGSVVSEEGRLITFPNTLQHKVSPFSLEDPSKPGHRKILALFLVDPHLRIISTANVPPQRQDWRLEEDPKYGDSHPSDSQKLNSLGSISMEEAKTYRAELMTERGLKSEESNIRYQEGSFCLCEH